MKEWCFMVEVNFYSNKNYFAYLRALRDFVASSSTVQGHRTYDIGQHTPANKKQITNTLNSIN